VESKFTAVINNSYFPSVGNNLQPATSLWDDIHQQKKRGGYPWTHLTHNPEAEVWIDPAALPRDIST
jgi:hypothetical protein